MSPRDFLRQLWTGHRVLMSGLALLLLANLGLGLALQQYLVPTLEEREQLVIRRENELHKGGGDSPAQLLAQGEKDLAAFHEKIPQYREFTALIVDLQTMAEDAGLELDQVNYSSEQEKDSDLLRYSLTFTLVGNYGDIKKFIHAMEQSSRLFVLRNINLQGSGKGPDTEVRLQLNLETFFRAGAP